MPFLTHHSFLRLWHFVLEAEFLFQKQEADSATSQYNRGDDADAQPWLGGLLGRLGRLGRGCGRNRFRLCGRGVCHSRFRYSGVCHSRFRNGWFRYGWRRHRRLRDRRLRNRRLSDRRFCHRRLRHRWIICRWLLGEFLFFNLTASVAPTLCQTLLIGGRFVDSYPIGEIMPQSRNLLLRIHRIPAEKADGAVGEAVVGAVCRRTRNVDGGVTCRAIGYPVRRASMQPGDLIPCGNVAGEDNCRRNLRENMSAELRWIAGENYFGQLCTTRKCEATYFCDTCGDAYGSDAGYEKSFFADLLQSFGQRHGF